MMQSASAKGFTRTMAITALCLMVVWYGASGLHNGFTRSSSSPYMDSPMVMPFFLLVASLVQLGVGATCAALKLKSGDLSLQTELAPIKFWLLGTLHYLTTLVTNAAYAGATVAMAQSIKAAEPMFVLVLSWMLLPRRRRGSFALVELLAVSMLSLGVVLLVRPLPSSPSSSPEAFATAVALGVASNVANALRSLYFKNISTEHKGGAMTVSHLMNVASFCVALPALAVGIICWPSMLSAVGSETSSSWVFLGLSLLAGASLFAYNQASFWVLSFTTPTSHAVLKALKRPVIVAVCLLLAPFIGAQFSNVSAGDVVLGLLLMFGGAGLQGFVAWRQAQPDSLPAGGVAKAGDKASLPAVVGLLVLLFVGMQVMSRGGEPNAAELELARTVSLAGAPPLQLSCFGILGNRGDLGVNKVCTTLFMRTAERLGLDLTVVPMSNITRDTLVVYGGGSLLNTEWAHGIWNKTIVHGDLSPTRWRYPMFFFGGGYDDNDLAWTGDRTLLESALVEAQAAIGGPSSAHVDSAQFAGNPLHLASPSKVHKAFWPAVTPHLKFGGTRGPFTSRAFMQHAAALNTTFPSASSVIGDSGIFIERYVEVSYDLVNEHNLASSETPYVLVLPGKGTDGLFLSGRDMTKNIQEEQAALQTMSVYLARKGYKVVFMPMSDERQDNLHTQHLCGNASLALPEEIRDNLIFLPVSSVENLLGLMANATVVVAHKLHGGVFSGAVGTPFVSIAYRSKHYDWALSIDALDMVVHIGDATPTALINKFEYVRANRDRLKKHLLSMVGMYEKRYEVEAERYLIAVAEQAIREQKKQ